VSSKGSASKPSECVNIATESRRSITVRNKMEVIRRMEGVQTRRDVCRSRKLPPSAGIT